MTLTDRRVYLDCEFDPKNLTTTGLISIAVTDQHGESYYAINAAADLQALLERPFIIAHVLPWLPIRVTYDAQDKPVGIAWDLDHPDACRILDPERIADDLADFFAAPAIPTGNTQLYAYYGAQDLNRLHQLWGGDWNQMPDVIPRWFTDLKAIAVSLGDPELPEQSHREHDALADARHDRVLHDFLLTLAGTAAAGPNIVSDEGSFLVRYWKPGGRRTTWQTVQTPFDTSTAAVTAAERLAGMDGVRRAQALQARTVTTIIRDIPGVTR
ncbi:hypothetical protein ABZ883_04645 [Streptomyces sp. NPDC046977]|uniref:hypothetical protein n=1 Tax=Streptomyces sp. NPDC046977 TaxID=3154703 RepID=UPI0033E40D8B